MIVFLWWTLSVAAALAAGAFGGVIYANYRIRVLVEEARITMPLAEARDDLTGHEDVAIALTRDLPLADYTGDGRHSWPQAAGSAAQLATWACDSRTWPIVRARYISRDRLEAVDV